MPYKLSEANKNNSNDCLDQIWMLGLFTTSFPGLSRSSFRNGGLWKNRKPSLETKIVRPRGSIKMAARECGELGKFEYRCKVIIEPLFSFVQIISAFKQIYQGKPWLIPKGEICYALHFITSWARQGKKISNSRNSEGFYIVLEEISKLEKEQEEYKLKLLHSLP